MTLEIIRSDAPPQTRKAFWLMVVLTVWLVIGLGWVLWDLVTFNKDPRLTSIMLGFVFIDLALLFDIYRKEFLPDEMVVKTRLEKVVPRKHIGAKP